MGKKVLDWTREEWNVTLTAGENVKEFDLSLVFPETKRKTLEGFLNDELFVETLFYGFKQKCGDRAASIKGELEKFTAAKEAGEWLLTNPDRHFNQRSRNGGKKVKPFVDEIMLLLNTFWIKAQKFEYLQKVDQDALRAFVMASFSSSREANKDDNVKPKDIVEKVVKSILAMSVEQLLEAI